MLLTLAAWLTLAAGDVSVTVPAPPEDFAVVRAALETAHKQYDLASAQDLLGRLRARKDEHPVEQGNRLLAEAALLAAELQRITFEETPDTQAAERRALGRAIDSAAEEGLQSLAPVTADSETWRLRADLIGTMIRSDFQAQKYRKKMDEAIAHALELDPKNSRAYVSAAKPFLFAPENHGRDLVQAVETLNTALALDPHCEQGLLLRAYAYEEMGQREKAVADWQAALAQNPGCRPARKKLSASP